MPSSPSSSTYTAPIASPTTTMTSTHSEPEPDSNNSLDDIFGSSPVEHQQYISTEEIPGNRTSHVPASAAAEPSDLPSLRRQHVTAGYRDGIASSKAEHVQRGFDGGYPVGAQFGLRVGTILGILEGVVGGLESTSSGTGPIKKKTMAAKRSSLRDGTYKDGLGPDKGEESQEAQIHRQRIERIRQLYKNALKELDVEALFGGLKAEDQEGGEIQGPDFTDESRPENRLRHKADPAVARWEKLVDVTKWEESMEAIESMEDQTVNTAEKEL
ncbi:hypothetical protein UA08_01873 [Talaromyces atroroseus]|uniref:Protein YAE1 n=1 Tax=Talaromyces atroroseus TaxID=1441469 RepID=A0A1Q5QA69_TALAT|nr:hypothetical protein UA08_01873 [Talaromyces atroroseus]OKL62810.1 hypothetical protein UA08_01873 [Talaromyces atroroseus]